MMKEGIAQWRRGVLTVCALVSGWSGLGWIPGQRRAVFLGKTIYLHGASPTQVYKWNGCRRIYCWG